MDTNGYDKLNDSIVAFLQTMGSVVWVERETKEKI